MISPILQKSVCVYSDYYTDISVRDGHNGSEQIPSHVCSNSALTFPLWRLSLVFKTFSKVLTSVSGLITSICLLFIFCSNKSSYKTYNFSLLPFIFFLIPFCSIIIPVLSLSSSFPTLNDISSSKSTSGYFDYEFEMDDDLFASVGLKDPASSYFEVDIPDSNLRELICTNGLGDSNSACIPTEFDMASITFDDHHDNILACEDCSITDLEGFQYLINIPAISLINNSITSVLPVSQLKQLVHIRISGDNDIPVLAEEDSDYWTYFTQIFPIHRYSPQKEQFFLPNNCSLNDTPGSTPYNCDLTTHPDDCPSLILNEVYNSVDNVKQCSFIAKSADGKCYTIHDTVLRAYLSTTCLSSIDINDGVISIASLRSSFGCSSLDLSVIFPSSVNSLTTLQGLEYAQGVDSSNNSKGLTVLSINGYDLSGDINDNAEYDKLVVQILSKTVSYGPAQTGLTSLSASSCGLSEISDVLDLTPPIANYYVDGMTISTPLFKLTSLDISDNNISDVSVLITSDLFSSAVLTTLDISNNSICDIEGMVGELSTYFGAGLSSITYSDQTCHCTASVSSSDHQVCREVYPDRWAVECWNGYYLDKASGECLEVCASGYELDSPTGTPPYSCTTAASDVDDSIRLQVCERHSN
ncbi:hypothetical protein ADUPG1_006901, partial [Aduncisulcus paluster]